MPNTGGVGSTFMDMYLPYLVKYEKYGTLYLYIAIVLSTNLNTMWTTKLSVYEKSKQTMENKKLWKLVDSSYRLESLILQ